MTLRRLQAQPTRRPADRRRRGVEAIEFALVFPLYLLLFFGIMEYSWFAYQKATVAEAVRVGCQAAGQLDPAVDDFELEASSVAQAELERLLGITCNDGKYTCATSFPLVAANFQIPRIVCEFRLSYVPLTGVLGGVGSSGSVMGGVMGVRSGVRFIPQAVVARSATIFENAEP